ncbi:MAG: ROK family protein [Acidimicrobiales bacterium]
MTRKKKKAATADPVKHRIGVDVGGTKILVARLEGDEVVQTKKRSTPRTGADDLFQSISEMVERVDPDRLAGTVGVGIPGQVDAAAGSVRSSPNIAGLDDEAVPICELLASELQRDVAVDNDVNVATLAEHQLGAAQGFDNVLGVFVGTGVGGGLILDGRLRHGPRGLAGEIGHMVVVHRDGAACGCGLNGHLEAYAGRASLERRARERHAEGADTALVEIAGDGRMKSSVWAKALDAGDQLARELIDEATDALVAGLTSVVVTVDIEFIVLGGGMADRLGEPFRADLERGINRSLFADAKVDVRWAQLGDDSGAIGAACLFS